MRGPFYCWKPTSVSSLKIRMKSTESWVLPELLQRLKISSLINDLFHKNQEDVAENNNDNHKDPYLNYKYINSGKTVASIQNRAKVLLHQIELSKAEERQLKKIGELVSHMKRYPVTRALLKREGGIKILLELRDHTQHEQIKMSARAALIILGYADPVKENGIRILSLDGGGTR